jgi:hypothetical protein
MRILFIGLFASGCFMCSASGVSLPFIDMNFEGFCKQMVPEAERLQFATYYQDMQRKFMSLHQTEQRKRKHILYDAAMDALYAEHKVWADTINVFVTDLQFLDSSYDQDRNGIRLFLERYGMYKEYERSRGIKVAQPATNTIDDFWKNIKVHVSKITDKVGSWFKSLRGESVA